MSQLNTIDTLNGLFKDVYADRGVVDLIPDSLILLNRIPFSQKEALGNEFVQPVVLQMEHGVTFHGSEDVLNDLNDAVAGRVLDARIKGAGITLRSVLSYTAASRAMKDGRASFESATKYLVGNMLKSASKKLEIELMYGQVGYGVVGSVAHTAPATTATVVIPAAEWAPGIWGGAEGMKIDFYDVTLATKRNALDITVTSVSFETRTIGLSGASADLAAIVATDVIFHKGAQGNEFAGVHKILSNTATLFGISATTYALWTGNVFSSSSQALSFQKLQDAVARGVEKGLDSDVMVIVNPKTWADLLTEQAALRRYDQSYSPAGKEAGSKGIKFHGQNGMIEIVPSIYCKEGYAYVLDESTFSRVGSTEITFKRPGQEGNFFLDRPNQNAYELRLMSDQALFCHAPARSVLITDIVN